MRKVGSSSLSSTSFFLHKSARQKTCLRVAVLQVFVDDRSASHRYVDAIEPVRLQIRVSAQWHLPKLGECHLYAEGMCLQLSLSRLAWSLFPRIG